ncbi:hypothetical protein ACFSSA_07040 [Luteolibacter algae]|uniref:DUF892 family protein n=1 Tax=Luteolibacter algae TaxID=454151 RepID=A0ABW5D5S4_9BACT
MKDIHHSSIIHYVNDIVAMERDIVNAVRTQLEDDRVRDHPQLHSLFLEIAVNGDYRAEVFEKLIAQEGGSLGGAIKEGIAAVAGVMAGLYGITRQHPLSHMVRDNTVAMNVASTSYSMLLTLALATNHKRCEELALSALNSCPKLVRQLTDVLPYVVLEEISGDAPAPNMMAAEQANDLIQRSWKQHEPV